MGVTANKQLTRASLLDISVHPILDYSLVLCTNQPACIKPAGAPWLKIATRKEVSLQVFTSFKSCIGNPYTRAWFGVIDALAVDRVPGTASSGRCIYTKFLTEQKIEPILYAPSVILTFLPKEVALLAESNTHDDVHEASLRTKRISPPCATGTLNLSLYPNIAWLL